MFFDINGDKYIEGCLLTQSKKYTLCEKNTAKHFAKSLAKK
jgi:hypothetical protein